jgi:hypothetical protein
MTCAHSDIHILGRFRISVTDAPRPVVVDDLPDPIGEIVARSADQRSAAQQQQLLTYFNESNLTARRADQELKAAIAEGRGNPAIAGLRAHLEAQRDTPEKIVEWEKRRAQGLPTWAVLEPVALTAEATEHAADYQFERMDDGSYFVSGPREPIVYMFRAKLPFPASQLSAVRLEVVPDSRLPNRGSGRDSGNFVITSFGATVVGRNDERGLTFDRASSDFSQRDFHPAQLFNEIALDGWAIWGDVDSQHEVVLETAPLETDSRETSVEFRIGQLHDDSHSLGRFRISVTDAARPVVVDRLPGPVQEVVAVGRDQRTEDQQRTLLNFFTESNVRVAQLEREIAEAATPKPFPLDAFVDRADPYAAPLDSFEIEAQIDESSAMVVTRHGVYWENNRGAKPGTVSPSGKFVKVNGAPWYISWINNSGAVEGEDQSVLYRLPLGPAIWDYELLAVTNASDGRPNATRGVPEHDVHDDHTELEIDDNAEGAGVYRIRFVRRK